MASEREILERLRGLNLGIGDDCALYRPQPDKDLVFTTDFLIEDVHFRRSTHTARDIGYKALARGLSDLAAMGATPRFCLLSLALPADVEAAYTDEIFNGLLELSAATDCPLAGGDLARAPLLICDIVACGSTERGRALLRSGAHVGDEIFVSGSLGGSALGLATMQGAAWQKHLRPQPRLALGRELRGKATAAMDLSDGLSIDLARLCRESGVAAEIDDPPVFPGASIDQALHGGEDYELLFTAQPGGDLPSGVFRIGRVVAGNAGHVRLRGESLAPMGYDHFRKP